MEATQAPITSILRRSCHFCRGRKIRCSGSAICSACAERNIDCVYDVQSGKGRPKGRSSKSSSKKDGSKNHSHACRQPTTDRSQPDSAMIGTSQFSVNSDGLSTQTIDMVLTTMFEENFGGAQAASTTFFQRIISESVQQGLCDQAQPKELRGYPPQDIKEDNCLAYDGLLSNIRTEMIALIASRFGGLECQFNESPHKLSYLRGILRDRATTMLDTPHHGRSPLLGLDPHRILQLIDTWFSIHPLSPLVSKTLLLTSLRSNTVDQALLAIILADAVSAHGTSKLYSGTTNTEESLFQYAISEVRDRPAGSHKLPTAQALVLIGWREMCRGSPRRATCWISYAGHVVAGLENRIRTGELRNHQRMNGVEVGMVESEIVRNIYWVTFSCIFWSMMQAGAPFSEIMPQSFAVSFPPVSESFSASISLDMASDNISTLLAQSRSLRELWPLSHVVCTTMRIYALDYPHAEPFNTTGTAAWQSRHPSMLRRLPSADLGATATCAKVCSILQKAIDEIECELQDDVPKSIVICAYRTIIIHLLFPRIADGVVMADPQQVHNFVQEASRLPQLALSLANATVTSGSLTRNMGTSSPLAGTLVLGLDACGRGLARLYECAFAGTEADYWTVASEKDQLALIAGQLHEISKMDLSREVTFIRPVKRRLKEAKIAFSVFGVYSVALARTGSSISHQSPSFGNQQFADVSAASTPLGDSRSFMPQLEDYSASNSGVGTPMLDPVHMSYYGSPSLSTLHQFDTSYFDDMDMVTFTETMHSKLAEYATPMTADTSHLDSNAWLYTPQKLEPLQFPDTAHTHGRRSVTSDPGSVSEMMLSTPFTAVPVNAAHYERDERQFW